MDIDNNKFMTIGMWCFFLITIFSIGNLALIWKTLNMFQISISITFIIFYFATSLYFGWMIKMQTPMMTSADLDNDKIVKDALDLLEKERKNHSEKK